MKALVMTIIGLTAGWFTASAQVPQSEIADRVALKELVDNFSNLADTKDVEAQVLLFTEDATVDSYRDGKFVSSLKGRRQLDGRRPDSGAYPRCDADQAGVAGRDRRRDDAVLQNGTGETDD